MKPAKQIYPRSIKISQEEISYKLRYSKKAKYLRMQISRGNELELILPRGYELKEAENFILKKSEWIKKHLHSQPSKKNDFFFFGKEIKVNQKYTLFTQKHNLHFEKDELIIISPENSKIELRKLFDAWLKLQAKNFLAGRAAELARQFGFQINKISIRGQKTRWGSCSARGSLSFNFMLMQHRKEAIDYVIIHELCHLREMNHSQNFWMLVEKFCPDYKNLRKELKGKSEI
ncbi:MAG: M48 family metallopeptidase [Ignavibacteriaceae bacterium]